MECSLRFPLFGIANMVVQKIFFREPAPHTSRDWLGKVLYRAQKLDNFRPMLRSREKPYDRKNHAHTYAKIVPTVRALAEAGQGVEYVCIALSEGVKCAGRMDGIESAYKLKVGMPSFGIGMLAGAWRAVGVELRGA